VRVVMTVYCFLFGKHTFEEPGAAEAVRGRRKTVPRASGRMRPAKPAAQTASKAYSGVLFVTASRMEVTLEGACHI
jgi:hypothetical protein